MRTVLMKADNMYQTLNTETTKKQQSRNEWEENNNNEIKQNADGKFKVCMSVPW